MNLDDNHWKTLVQAARSDLPPAIDETRILAAYSALQLQSSPDWVHEFGRLFGRPALQVAFGIGGLAALLAGLLLSASNPASLRSDSWAECVSALEVRAS